MSFSDIFKKSFLNGYVNATIDVKATLITLAITTVLALFIFLIYRIITRKSFYEKTFNISLIAMSIITAAIILTIQSNVVLSLGMVGALSIIRFRTAIKDPLDLVFLYWAISVGIICGAGLAGVAVILCLVLTIVVFLMRCHPNKKMSKVLSVNSQDATSYDAIVKILEENTKYYNEKSKAVANGKMELIFEVMVIKDTLVEDISKIDSIISVALFSHEGEISA